MESHELYLTLRDRLGRGEFRRTDLGEGMAVLENVIGGYWRERYLLNDNLGTAYELMDGSLRLKFVTRDDIDWPSVSKLENNENTYTFSAYYPRFSVGRFTDGVASVKWTLYPDGMFFMDEDGFGMEHNNESAIIGYIDTRCHVVIPFQAKGWREMDAMRPLAASRAREMAEDDRDT